MYVRCTLKVHKKQFSHPVYIQIEEEENSEGKTSTRIFQRCCCIFCWLSIFSFLGEKKQKESERERCEFFFLVFFLCLFMLQPKELRLGV